MNYTINIYPVFKREFKRLNKRYQSLAEDLERLRDELLQNPEMGVDLGGGLHKVRMRISSKGKGKSGGARVITLLVQLSSEEKEIGFHYIYDKSERENITDSELREILMKNSHQ